MKVYIFIYLFFYIVDQNNFPVWNQNFQKHWNYW